MELIKHTQDLSDAIALISDENKRYALFVKIYDFQR